MGHKCAEERKEHLATSEKPFHFTDSGLSYVYLVGIKYFTCSCGRVIADIPAIKQLMQLIARDTLSKPSALAGEEVRFLRKRLGRTQVDFAKAIGIESETLCRYENDQRAVSEVNDKLIRLYYIFAAKEDIQLDPLRKAIEDLFAEWKANTQVASKKIVASVRDNNWQTKREVA